MRIALTGGGTGGHIYPALSVAEAIRALCPDAELLFVGSRHGPESGLAEDHSIPFVGIPSRPLTKKPSLGAVRAFGLLGLGIFRAKAVLDGFKPDVVIGTGGYTSASVVLAQSLLRKGPALIQEQNALPGRTNMFVSRFVSAVCVAFEESARHFAGRKARVEVTGVPIRKSILERPARDEARLARPANCSLRPALRKKGGSFFSRAAGRVHLTLQPPYVLRHAPRQHAVIVPAFQHAHESAM